MMKRLIITSCLFTSVLFAGGPIAKIGFGADSNKSLAAGFIDSLETSTGLEKIVDVGEELPSLSGSFLAAQIAAANGDDKAAAENFQRAIEFDPENTNLKQSLFMAMTTNGDIAEAIELLEKIPTEAQDKNVNHVVIAIEALRKKSWTQALTRIDRIEGADLDTIVAKLVGSWALFGDRKLDEALERADSIEGPDWSKLIKEYHMGLMLAASGKPKEAVTRLQNAVALKSVAAALTETYMRAVEALAITQLQAEDRKGAIHTIHEGLTLLPEHPPLIQLKADLQDETPVTALVNTAQQGASEVFYNVGSAISRQGGLPFAQSHLQLANYLHPESDSTLFSLAGVYEDQNKYDRAINYYNQIPETSPYRRRAQIEVAMNFNRLDMYDDAVGILSDVVEQNPKDFLAALSLGSVFSQKEAYDKAAVVYDGAIRHTTAPKRRDWLLFYRRGIAFERTRQWDKAEADFKRALELYPDQPDVLNYLGYSWIDQGINLDEGLDLVKRAVDIKPNSGFIIDSLGWAHYRLGQYEDAVTQLERALQLMPSDPVINDHLGDAYWKADRKLEAMFQWKHALSNKPTDVDRIKINVKLRDGLKD